jgi:primary-amine oxidase
MPVENHNFDEMAVAARFGLREPLKPIRITQPEGSNVAFDGSFIEWQKWRFHLRFDLRVGTVFSLMTYDGRSVLYQGALSEIFVPYQDPGANWYYRTFMDAGEFGMGLLASPLALGLDVPENAVLMDAVISAAIPDPEIPVIPLPLERVIGVFERVTGNPSWRHFELFSPDGPSYEGRAEVELVVRMIAQVGNYDYLVDWIFAQNGTLRVDVGLTGIDVTKAVNSTHRSDPTFVEDTKYGALVAPQLVATHHSHHFNFRLDVDVDGPMNDFLLGHLEPVPTPDSLRRSVWVLEQERLKRESQGALDNHGSVWTVINPMQQNSLGYPTGYRLESHSHGEPLMHPADFRRARFIAHDLWVTAYDADERYASGDTPNQNPGTPGLPQYQHDNERLRHADIVLWHNLSFHHVTVAEDYPVLSRHSGSFELRPSNFFDHNPALDLRREPFEVP